MARITDYKKTANSDWQPWDYTSQPEIDAIPADGKIRWQEPGAGRPRGVIVHALRYEGGAEESLP